MKEWKLFVMLVASAFFLAYLAGAATLDVAPGQSIQDAIDKADAGDTIAIKAGVYYETLHVSKPLAIRGTNETTWRQWRGQTSPICLNRTGISFIYITPS